MYLKQIEVFFKFLSLLHFFGHVRLKRLFLFYFVHIHIYNEQRGRIKYIFFYIDMYIQIHLNESLDNFSVNFILFSCKEQSKRKKRKKIKRICQSLSKTKPSLAY